jgi:hypothetical protein
MFFRALLGGKLLREAQLAELKRTVATDNPMLPADDVTERMYCA